MFKVIILPLAKQDLRLAKLWYESKSKGLGNRFLNEVKLKIDFIKKHQLASTIKYDNIHTTLLDIFPFLIHYRVDNESKSILIIAVLHTSLDSEKWEERS